jgi:hypothetical protein
MNLLRGPKDKHSLKVRRKSAAWARPTSKLSSDRRRERLQAIPLKFAPLTVPALLPQGSLIRKPGKRSALQFRQLCVGQMR